MWHRICRNMNLVCSKRKMQSVCYACVCMCVWVYMCLFLGTRAWVGPNEDSEKMGTVNSTHGLLAWLGPTPETSASRASNIIEIVFCGLTNRRSTGLSTSPETQTLLILIQYSWHSRNCKDRSPLSNLDSNQRKQATGFFPFHFPLMHENYGATLNSACLP